MKDIAVTLPGDVAPRLRVRAAEDERSVSRWLAERNPIEGMRRREDEYEIEIERISSGKSRKMEWGDGHKLIGDELHDRAGAVVVDTGARQPIVYGYYSARSS